MAATLPFVITLLELLLPFPAIITSKGDADSNWRLRLSCLAFFWIALALFAAFRAYLIGAFVGGYGSGGLQAMLGSLRVFADKATLLKIFFPNNEEVLFGFAYRPLLTAAYAMIVVSLAVRILLRLAPIRPFIFLLGTASVMVLPAFQIWRLNPNLVGSRLFFISSAPLCIFIALAALPAIDRISRQWAQKVTIVGVLCLATIFALWSYLLSGNLTPWTVASRQMDHLRAQVQLLAGKCPQGKCALAGFTV